MYYIDRKQNKAKLNDSDFFHKTDLQMKLVREIDDSVLLLLLKEFISISST